MRTLHTLAVGIGAASLAVAQVGAAATPQPGASPATAQIAAVVGSALVSNNKGIVPALAGMELEPLNRIFVLEDSQATIEFGDGCRQELSENAMLTISDSGTCEQTAEAAPQADQSMAEIERCATSALGANTVLGPSCKAAAAAAPVGAGVLFVPVLAATPALLAVGGAAAVGGVIWAATDNNNNNNTPAAPAPSPPASDTSPE